MALSNRINMRGGGEGSLNFDNVFNGTDGLNENLSIIGGVIQGSPKYINFRTSDSSVSIIGIDFTDYRYMVVDAQTYSQSLQYRIHGVVNYTSFLSPGAGRVTVNIDISSVTGAQILEFCEAIQGAGYGYIYNITLSK